MREYIKKLIITSLTVIFVAYIIISIINKDDTIQRVQAIKNTIGPFIAGAGIAYLVNFIYKKIYNTSKSLLSRKITDKLDRKLMTISLVLSEIIFIGFIGVIIFSIVPSLMESIQSISQSLPHAIDETRRFVDMELESREWLASTLGEDFDTFQLKIQDYLTTTLNDNIEELSKYVLSLVGNTLTYTISVVISLIVNIMLLANKDQMLEQSKLLILAIFRDKSKYIFEELSIANEKFGGFFIGKVIDSTIVGIIAFVGCLVLRVKYAGLIAFIIGVFNVIPIAGPFIGAIPSLIMIFSQSPKLALYFLVFIVILQQLDGNIIGPKCIGQSTNINSFWVLASIIIFGKLFGFIGMIIGVPLFAVIQDIINKVVEYRLRDTEGTLEGESDEEFVDTLIK